MTYPRDYRQERTYGFSAIGVILTLVGVIVIMLLVVIMSGTVVFFPFGGSYEIEPNPQFQTAVPSIIAYYILIASITVAVIAGSWVYSRGRLSSESQ